MEGETWHLFARPHRAVFREILYLSVNLCLCKVFNWLRELVLAWSWLIKVSPNTFVFFTASLGLVSVFHTIFDTAALFVCNSIVSKFSLKTCILFC